MPDPVDFFSKRSGSSQFFWTDSAPFRAFAAIDGLPVGMMLVGRPWEEATIYRAAHAFEQSGDSRDG